MQNHAELSGLDMLPVDFSSPSNREMQRHSGLGGVSSGINSRHRPSLGVKEGVKHDGMCDTVFIR